MSRHAYLLGAAQSGPLYGFRFVSMVSLRAAPNP
jgi:hypothetical protein